MKNAKKLICILVLGCIVCTHSYNVYQTCYATETVAVGGLAAAGVALLGLGAICGVGMDLENNKRFNELSDEEKTRIENGLATDFNDVALQRGASVEKIKNWTTDLCNGVLDKTSECWGIFKDWIKNVSLENGGWKENVDFTYGASVPVDSLLGFNYNGYTLTQSDIDYIKSTGGSGDNIGWQISKPLGGGYKFRITKINNNSSSFVINQYNNTLTWNVLNNGGVSNSTSGTFNNYISNFNNYNIMMKATKPVKLRDLNGVVSDLDYNGVGVSASKYFSTNTDYLEKLKGQDEDVIDVIDVTDIKNPIIETRPNKLTNIDWNRGTRRTNNNKDDDDNKMVTGLVPMDVWYEQIDDEQEEMKNAVVVYDNYIQEHPQEKDTYFISTTPVTNINNYFNTLPVVNFPAQGTVVNNNYEYNNYNNNNVTIYQEPYNAGIIPTFPDFKNKFPFCIPFDLYEFFVVFLAEKEAPKIEIPFPIIDNTNHQLTVEHITIDLAPYEYLSDVLRVMLFVLFCVGLMILTRQLIKG